MLTQKAEEVTIADIVRIMEGGIEITHCCNDIAAKDCPRTEQCLTRAVWVRASRALERELDAITLADILDGSITLDFDEHFTDPPTVPPLD